MTPVKRIRAISDEMEMLKDMRENNSTKDTELRNRLEDRYKEIEIFFGSESTLDKAIIYFLNEQKDENITNK